LYFDEELMDIVVINTNIYWKYDKIIRELQISKILI
jgi:hypothetical protein